MHLLLPLLIMAAPPASSSEGRHPDTVEVYHCDFGQQSDVNFDDWPDDWTRRRGIGYPTYVEIAVRKEPSAVGDSCLRVNLDGGAAAVFSPPVSVSPQFSYILEVYVKTEQLVHDVAFTSLVFYDTDRKPLETHYSKRVQKLPEWKKIVVGPVTPHHDNISQAIIGLHLAPHAPQQADLRGAALFDDVWLGRMPRMTLHTNSEHNVYTDPSGVNVTCKVSGILERDPMMTFELIDVGSNQLAKMENRLDGDIVAQQTTRASALLGKRLATPDVAALGYAGTMEWKPPIEHYGFYQVRVTMLGSSGTMQRRMLSLAVIRPQKNPVGGEFGWALPMGDKPLALGPLAGLLGQVGVNWVKFPVWYSEKEADRGDQLARFIERLNRQNIEVVGLLDRPPEDAVHLFGDSERLLAVNTFSESQLWHPVLNPVMTRLSLKVRWWQLGGDDDASFMGFPDLETKITEVKRQLERFGQEVNLGFPWGWIHQGPAADSPPPPWSFLSYDADPPMTQEELGTYLDATPTSGVKRWVQLTPLSRRHYRVEDRARDLVGRMLAAKRGNADCVFIPRPFDRDHGLMNPDGTPDELFLPWRTTSLMISGSQYVGSIALPQGSSNYIYARGEDAVMVLWNERPVTETIFLGENVQRVDLWGRITKPELDGHRQIIEVSSLPTFLTGVNLPVARWRMEFAFGKKELSSVFERPQLASYRLRNFFDQGVSGEITLVTPKVWETDPATSQFRLAVGEELHKKFQVKLQSNASSGEQDVRVDFDLSADRSYKFSVYRTMMVGLGDVVLALSAQLNERGELVVEQRLFNKSDKFVSFNCLLYAPSRRRMRHQVLDQPRGRNDRTYILPNGKELLGKPLWLRAEEIGGDRILSYRIIVQE